MSYETQSAVIGRKPIVIVELDLDFCANTYGSSPCTAAVGVTGTQKCFNCFKTCQDTANYSRTTKTYKFCSDQSFLPIGDTYFPCVSDVEFSSTQLKLNGISVDCSAVVTFNDFTDSDLGIDPYVSDRAYDPKEQGTFFGKLHTRNPYMNGRVMRVKEGYIDDDRTLHTQTRTYLIDRMDRPDAKGRVKLYGKGILRAFSEGKNKAPAYLATLNGTIAASGATGIPLTIESPRGDLFGTSGAVLIDSEILSYTSRTGNTLNVTSGGRASFGTTATSHTAGARIYQVKSYIGSDTSHRLTNILYYIMVDCALVPPSFVTLADWEAEFSAKFTAANFYNLRTLRITKPKPAKDFVQEICESIGISMWYDELNAKIRLKVIDGDDSDVPVWDDDIILSGSLSWKELEKERFSQFAYSVDSVGGDEVPKLESADFSYVFVDADVEGENAYNTSVNKEIGSRWINAPNAIEEVALRYIAVFAHMRREIVCRVDAVDATPEVGDYVDVQTRHIQAFDGSARVVRCVVTEKTPQYPQRGSQFQYKLVQVVKDADGQPEEE